MGDLEMPVLSNSGRGTVSQAAEKVWISARFERARLQPSH